MSHLLVLTDQELADVVSALEVRVVDERRLAATASDEGTRRLCQYAADRLEILIDKLEES